MLGTSGSHPRPRVLTAGIVHLLERASLIQGPPGEEKTTFIPKFRTKPRICDEKERLEIALQPLCPRVLVLILEQRKTNRATTLRSCGLRCDRLLSDFGFLLPIVGNIPECGSIKGRVSPF